MLKLNLMTNYCIRKTILDKDSLFVLVLGIIIASISNKEGWNNLFEKRHMNVQ